MVRDKSFASRLPGYSIAFYGSCSYNNDLQWGYPLIDVFVKVRLNNHKLFPTIKIKNCLDVQVCWLGTLVFNYDMNILPVATRVETLLG